MCMRVFMRCHIVVGRTKKLEAAAHRAEVGHMFVWSGASGRIAVVRATDGGDGDGGGGLSGSIWCLAP